MSIFVFAGYSKRFFTSKLPEVLPNVLHRSVSRSIRVLWFMNEMGGGWLSIQDLRNIGAAQWKVLQYVIPDLLKDDLIAEVRLTRKNGSLYFKYKINQAGIRLLEIVNKHVEDEYQKAVEKCQAFKI